MFRPELLLESTQNFVNGSLSSISAQGEKLNTSVTACDAPTFRQDIHKRTMQLNFSCQIIFYQLQKGPLPQPHTFFGKVQY